MNRIITILSFLFVFVCISLAQDICGTPPITIIDNVKRLSSPQKRSANSHYTLTVYFHVIRSSSGTGGVTALNVTSAYNRLNQDFNSHGIYFNWDGLVDYIDDNTYFNYTSTSIFNVRNHINGIDIYLFPSSMDVGFTGFSNGIGVSSGFCVVGNIDGTPACTTSTISHEMGHVLNLWHTHHGTFTEGNINDPDYDIYQCRELVDGSNSSTCGDYVEDTPADPNLLGIVNSNCIYIGTGIDANNQAYTPDVDLIMSYSRNSCRTRFSAKQGERMRDAIENLPYLMHTRCYTLSGSSTFCADSSTTYQIDDLPSIYTVDWSINNSNFIISPSGNQCSVTYTGTPQYSVAYLTANIKWNGISIKTLTKRIVMHGTDMMVYGQQLDEVTPFGVLPGFTFTIPASEEPTLNSNQAAQLQMLREKATQHDSVVWTAKPVVFVDSPRNLYDEPEYGITEINGEFDISLSSTRFDGMDISFSGAHAPLNYSTSPFGVMFRMPAASSIYDINGYYDVMLNATSPGGCHDFSLCFRVMSMDGQATGDDVIYFNKVGSSIEICFYDHWGNELPNGMIQNYPWTLNIYRVSSGTRVHGSVNTTDCKTVSASGWSSGVYLITVDCNGNHYTKMFVMS